MAHPSSLRKIGPYAYALDHLGQVPREIAATMPVILVVNPIHHQLQRKFWRQLAQDDRLVDGRKLVQIYWIFCIARATKTVENGSYVCLFTK